MIKRTLIGIISIISIAALFMFIHVPDSIAEGKTNKNEKLQFNENGRYKIVQFNDTQDDEDIDPRTIELMNTVLDEQQPDLVIVNGDLVNGDIETPEELKQAMDNVVKPMEERGIQWAVTFGNHDEDHTEKTGIDEEDMLNYYMSFEHNVNKADSKDITGTGNANLVIKNSEGNAPAFNIWLFDSGRYAPEEIAGQDFEGYQTWDWIRPDQIKWYYETSEKLEQTAGYKVPSLAFMHIPLPEFEYMWYGSPYQGTQESHQKAVERHNITGEKNECVCTGPFNSGLFSAMLDRGDVKGVFSGHDHINTYVGNYYGIMLGYAGSTGFGAYGLGGEEDHRLRGARVFHLDENAEDIVVNTEMVFAKDYGIK